MKNEVIFLELSSVLNIYISDTFGLLNSLSNWIKVTVFQKFNHVV